jgi:hypothetical protein
MQAADKLAEEPFRDVVACRPLLLLLLLAAAALAADGQDIARATSTSAPTPGRSAVTMCASPVSAGSRYASCGGSANADKRTGAGGCCGAAQMTAGELLQMFV